ncbi:MAG: phospholipase D-like domain-containing protein [Thermoplasmatota archaeon]
MQKRMVGKAVVVILLLSISTAVVNLHDAESNEIQFQRSGSHPIATFNYTGNITGYSAPDSSYEAFKQLLNSVNDTLIISVYEFQNIHLARSISNLSKDGIDVRLLVESAPVGGISKQEKYCLSMMNSSGVKLKSTDSKDFEYSYLHSKYIVADNRYVLISSENFGYTGYPLENTNGNRGWGVVVEDKDTANYYGHLFNRDWNNSKWMAINYQSSIKVESNKGGYSPEFDLKTINGNIKLRPVICPDHSLSNHSILRMIRNAEHSISIQQFYIDDWKQNPYVEAVIEAAERGCEVKILLDSTWYNILEDEKDNDDFVEYINNYSENNDLKIEGRLVNRYHGLSKSHNKGMIIDGEKVLISSINWNLHSINNNREVGIIVERRDTATFFNEIFLHDWKKDLIKPIPEAGSDKTVSVGQKTTFDGSHSWDDNDIVSYHWDFDGDGSYDKEGKYVNYTYDEEGEYEVILKVRDQKGHESIDEALVKVEKNKDSKPKIYYSLFLIPIVFFIGLVYLKKLKR